MPGSSRRATRSPGPRRARRKSCCKSLFRDDQALRLKLSADPRLWSWCLKFLRNCTSERARRNTLRKLKLCVYSQKALQELVAETGVDYDGVRKGLLYVYRDEASLERGIANMAILREAGQRMEMLDRGRGREDRAGLRVEPRDASPAGSTAPTTSRATRTSSPAAWPSASRSAGVEFRFSTTVTGFETSGDKIEKVVTDNDAIAADNVVLALGSYSPDRRPQARPAPAGLSDQGLLGDAAGRRLQRDAGGRRRRREQSRRLVQDGPALPADRDRRVHAATTPRTSPPTSPA